MKTIADCYAEIANAKRILAEAYKAFHAKGVTNRQKLRICAVIIKCQNHIIHNVHVINFIKEYE